MKVNIELVDTIDEEIAIIKAHELTKEINEAIELLKNGNSSIPVINNGNIELLPIKKIYYIESIDNKTFIYDKENVYETKQKLYELENLGNNFLRCSKSMIINIKKIKSVRATINAKMECILLNDEKLEIARSYVKDLKLHLGL